MLRRELQKRLAISATQGEGFFAVGGLASAHRGAAHFGMGGGNGQIDDNLNFGIGEQFVHTVAFNVILCRLRVGAIKIQIGAGHNFDIVKGFVGL